MNVAGMDFIASLYIENESSVINEYLDAGAMYRVKGQRLQKIQVSGATYHLF